jgi:hemolysin III
VALPLTGDAAAPRAAFTVRMDAARAQSRPEEWANAASHALGVALAFAVWPWLADAAQVQGGALGVAAMAVFVGTMALQYAVSAAYHALPAGRTKRWARAADHAAIYLFIAGSATPFTLGLIDGGAGVATCALVWTLALGGAALKLTRRLTSARLSTGLYILFGWLALLLVWPDLQRLDASALAWVLGGGAAYLVGAGFFVFDASLRFGHFIWHLFALLGSGCHVCAVLWPAWA